MKAIRILVLLFGVFPIILGSVIFLVELLWELVEQPVKVTHMFEDDSCSRVFEITSDMSKYPLFNPLVLSITFTHSETLETCLGDQLSHCWGYTVEYQEFLEYAPIRIYLQGHYVCGVNEESDEFAIHSNTLTCFPEWIGLCIRTYSVSFLADSPTGCTLVERINVRVPKILAFAAKAEAIKQRTDVHGRMAEYLRNSRATLEKKPVSASFLELIYKNKNVCPRNKQVETA